MRLDEPDDDDDLRFGDLGGGDGSAAPGPLSEQLIEYVRAGFILIVGLYVILYMAHALFGTPDPTGFF